MNPSALGLDGFSYFFAYRSFYTRTQHAGGWGRSGSNIN